MENIFYYSTNQSLTNVIKIKQERQSKLRNILKEWENIDEVVLSQWENLYHNAILLEGQTSHLGFYIQVVEADYYAPQRVWIHFHTPKKTIAIEFHKTQLLKKINGVKINDIRKILRFTNEMSFVKRAIEILMPKKKEG